jgi:hypothetical protein
VQSRYVDTLGSNSSGINLLKPPLSAGPAQAVTPPGSTAPRLKVAVFTPPPAPPPLGAEAEEPSAPPFGGSGPVVAAEAKEIEAMAAAVAEPVTTAAAGERPAGLPGPANQPATYFVAAASAPPSVTVASSLPDLDF